MACRINPLLQTDSYKASHFAQYPPTLRRLSAYIESRGGAFEQVVFFGLQAFIKSHLLTPISPDDIDEAEALLHDHGLVCHRAGWQAIIDEFAGYLPVTIEAVPEGTVMPPGHVQVQVTSAPGFAWLTTYLETALLRAVWYPSTVASLSRRAKQLIKAGLDKTSDEPNEALPFKLHDFGARGATASEAAMLGGMAHLVNFMGTDTVEALVGARRYYHEPMAGFSIPASEHSTITSWTEAGELEAFAHLLERFPTGIVACVSDSYDIHHAVRELWGRAVKERILARDGTLVVRPDSGDPTTTPLDVIESLMAAFGHHTNAKGYRVLPPQVRVIQGDGMNLTTIEQLINNAIDRGIAVDNFAMGMGGGLLQQLNRDTCRYAMKANACDFGQGWVDIQKTPASDPSKASKKGRLVLSRDSGQWRTLAERDWQAMGADRPENHLQTVYQHGTLVVDQTLSEIRARAELSLNHS